LAEIERLRRPFPERTGPIRCVGALARGAATGAGASAREPGPGTAEKAGAGAEPEAGRGEGGAPSAVDLAYRVIEDTMRQGQEAARQIATGLTGGLAAPGSFQALTERLVRDGLVWIESLAKLWAAVDPPEAPGAVASPSGRGGVRVRVASRAPAEVTVELRPGALGRDLAVHALRGPDAAAPPIEAVSFQRVEESGSWYLVVRVPDGQPPALYSGVVYDSADGGVLGTVAVRVDSEGAAP
jgi:hypothetical protein